MTVSKSRLLVVLLSYLFSSLGIFFTLLLFLEGLKRPTLSTLFPIVWIAAWSCHLIMSVEWISNRRTPRLIPIAGVILGTISLLIMPVKFALSPPPFPMPAFAPQHMWLTGALRLLGSEMLMVLPSLLLAVFLVRFNLKSESTPANG